MDSFYRSNKNYARVAEQIEKSRAISDANKAQVRGLTERLIAEGVSAGRIKKYLTIVRNISHMVGKDYEQLTPGDVQAVLAGLHRRKLATWTINDYKVTIRRLISYVRHRPLSTAMRVLLKVDKKGPNKFQLTYADLLTRQEIDLLVRAAPSPMHKCLVSLAYESAARPTELLTLTLGSISHADGYTKLSIRESKTFTRTIYSLDTDHLLKGWLNMHPFKGDRDAPLFPSRYLSFGTKVFLQPEAYNSAVKRFAQKAGVSKRVYSYLLRHSRITHLLEAGWSEVMIKKLVGHSVDSACFKVYEHLAERQVEDYVVRQHRTQLAEQQENGVVTARVCPLCSTANGAGIDFCVHCQRPISLKAVMEEQDKERELLRMLTPEMIDALVEKKVQEALRARSARPWQEAA